MLGAYLLRRSSGSVATAAAAGGRDEGVGTTASRRRPRPAALLSPRLTPDGDDGEGERRAIRSQRSGGQRVEMI
jgi:hypothetical protein